MAKTLIGVVYGIASKCPRRTIIPDDDAHLDWVEQNLPPALAMVRLQRGLLPAHPTIPDEVQAGIDITTPLIAQHHGINLVPSIRAAIIDSAGLVVDTLMADPALYPPLHSISPEAVAALANQGLKSPVTPRPPFTVVAHDTATVGGTLINGVYTPPVLATVPQGAAP